MRPLVEKGFFVLLMVSVVGCGTINYRDRIDLPAQNIDVALPHGKTRVIVFNATEPSWKTGAFAAIQVAINGKYAATVRESSYVQLFLDPGEYAIKLEFVDALTFTDHFNLNLGNEPLYIKITREHFASHLEVVAELPHDFTESYSAVPQ